MPYKNIEAKRAQQRRYARTPKGRQIVNAATRKWRAKNPEWVSRSNARAVKKARTSTKARAGYLISHAKIRRKCTLTRDWVQMRIEAGCALTGLPFNVTTDRRHPLSPSIDRINSKLDYTPENCRVIALALNVGLSDWDFSTVLNVWRNVK